MPSVGVGQQHGVWEMLAQHVGIADWNHIVEDAVDDQARLRDLAELGETFATVLFPSSKGRDLSDCDILAGQRIAILLSLVTHPTQASRKLTKHRQPRDRDATAM